MPLNPILVIEIFDCWGIDFMGPFPPSFGFFFFFLIKFKKYIISKRARQACNTRWEPAEIRKCTKEQLGNDIPNETETENQQNTS